MLFFSLRRTSWLCAIFVCAATVVPSAFASKFYWTSGIRTLDRANLDGTQSETILDQEFGLATGLAINQREEQIYWVEAIPVDKIRRSSLDGTNLEDLLFLTGQPASIDLDLEADKMYWTERFSNELLRANLDGTDVETIVVGAIEPRGIRVDTVNDHVYWVELGPDRLRRANLDGTGVVDILTSGMTRPFDLELDIPNETIYWSEFGTDSGNDFTGSIFRTDFAGSAPQLVVDGLSQPSSIDLDSKNNDLWIAHGLNRTIDRFDLTDETLESVVDVVGVPGYVLLYQVPEPTSALLAIMGTLPVIASASRRRQVCCY